MKAGVVAWHDLECGSYAADLALWRELADDRGGPVLDLGAGTGRVTLDLASLDYRVTALDSESQLVHELANRARRHGLRVDAVTADARSFDLGGARFSLAIAPMQVFQLLGGADGRTAALARVRVHLEPGGLVAVALADPFDALSPEDLEPPLPDVHEQDGWVLSSQPLAVRPGNGSVEVDRLRQLVSPEGELSEELDTVALDLVTPEELENEARAAGLEPAGRRVVPPTSDYIGATVVLAEAPR